MFKEGVFYAVCLLLAVRFAPSVTLIPQDRVFGRSHTPEICVSLADERDTGDVNALGLDLPVKVSARLQDHEVAQSHNNDNDADFKLSYFFNNTTLKNQGQRNLEQFFEYEQGRSDISVKSRLKSSFYFWQNIGTSPFILEIIKYGYVIPFKTTPEKFILKKQ